MLASSSLQLSSFSILLKFVSWNLQSLSRRLYSLDNLWNGQKQWGKEKQSKEWEKDLRVQIGMKAGMSEGLGEEISKTVNNFWGEVREFSGMRCEKFQISKNFWSDGGEAWSCDN